ncbi:FERM domain-containing protein 8 isoform X1 [Rhinatrema bivittatum]|uniref:FERM domain-containing protein 8 isoform X1 n=1 Tax=Rhinatrema bivittatum TaxID=194408 RepID=UPI00112E52D1|nr:FERM domain-containing protein 8 isoform X1 [Rhinatrema bivittatum]XP_029467103.1 FERM domain-containing protein 8 isoform X1 [Rhinatrema bivittatum]XP_029467104.1 FERM domain-containing protein 8 isoform X1 [Rhinatrema bivittatum]XP_029467105.1 FERM domain-containing protein 8 isoform X1 [Rhinatrema bivittatum]
MEGSDTGSQAGPTECSQRSSVSSIGAKASLDVLVYLINDTAVQLMVESITSITTQELHRIVRDVLQLPEVSQEVFSLWLISPLLELQLKPKHQPYKLCRQWQELLFRFTDSPEDDIVQDEPSLQFRRNVFFPKRRELQVDNEDVLRLLYEEAKFNVLEGRYPCDVEDCEKLGALVCRLELGPFDQDQHTPSAFKGKLQSFLPGYLCKKRPGRLLMAFRSRGAKQGSFEQTLLDTYKQVTDGSACEETEVLKKHYREYLQRCHELPYYGCAFFSGMIDKPAQGFLHRGGRKAVSVGISMDGVYVIDSKEKHLLLGLHFHELSWDHTYPEEEEHILWLEFDGDNEGTPVNKLLKIYSKQAELMSGLIEYCIDLNATTEAASQETTNATAASPQDPPPVSQLAGKRGKLRRQSSVICNRIQHLATIDYVDDGKEIKRVKPRRTASFFSRQSSHSHAPYSAVQGTEGLEQG